MRSSTCDAPPRRAGVLLHPTSLPGPHGVGDLGAEARRFVDWLAAAGQGVWQVLPLAPTGYGDSPYQALSAFGGNPLLLAPEELARRGWLDAEAVARPPPLPAGRADYGAAAAWKGPLLRAAAERFAARAGPPEREALEAYRARHAGWLDDLALFLALKERHGGVAWTRWDPPLARREPGALAEARRVLEAEVRAHVFAQWAFDEQWTALRAHARARGVALLGDLPIYLAHDSAEVWARRELFRLDPRGEPVAVAGVPPDYFSATGQLWGNPLHDWAAQAARGFDFWIDRLRRNLELFDLVRLDHFRGFEAYWEVPAGAASAAGGRWVAGPGAALFEALEAALGRPLPLVAENLGVITPAVEALRRRFGLPGMAVLQFAFGDDPQADDFLPHNYRPDLVAYTGTHDNDTAVGWWSSEAGEGSTRTAEQVARERAHALAYLAADGREMNWTLLRGVYASVAALAVAPLQDLLGLGSEARMNVPATADGNWRWRLRAGALTPALAERVRALAALYGRSAGSVSSNQ
jgi:4-alpha-glucanotransferase